MNNSNVSATSNNITENMLNSIKVLTILYLHPDYYQLRKSLEWLIEYVNNIKNVEHKIIKDVLCTICLEVYTLAENSGCLLGTNIDTTTGWALSLTCAAMFDKEYSFLDNHEEHSSVNIENKMQLDDTSPLVVYLSFLERMFSRYSRIVSAQELDSSAEVMRYAECCGECMRAIMTVLKSRKGVYVVDVGADKWMVLIDSMISNGCMILLSDLVHKDTVTATAMSVICLQWIARYRLSGQSFSSSFLSRNTTPSLQLLAILKLLDLSSSSSFLTCTPPDTGKENEDNTWKIIGEKQIVTNNENNEYKSAKSCGVHVEFINHFPALPIISKCAILRACLTVFDDQALSFTPSLSSSTTTTTATSTITHIFPMSEYGTTLESDSLLLGPLFSATIAVCNHVLPLVRLYGLQTLESWFNCFEVIIGTPVVLPLLSSRSASKGDQNNENENNDHNSYKNDDENKDDTLGNEVGSFTSAECISSPSLQLIPKLKILSTLLITTWNHPSKQVGGEDEKVDRIGDKDR